MHDKDRCNCRTCKTFRQLRARHKIDQAQRKRAQRWLQEPKAPPTPTQRSFLYDADDTGDIAIRKDE